MFLGIWKNCLGRKAALAFTMIILTWHQTLAVWYKTNRWNTRNEHLWIASWFQILFKSFANKLWGLPNQVFWQFWGLFGTFSSYFVYYFSLSELCIGQGRHSWYLFSDAFLISANCVWNKSGISVVRSEWAACQGLPENLRTTGRWRLEFERGLVLWSWKLGNPLRMVTVK